MRDGACLKLCVGYTLRLKRKDTYFVTTCLNEGSDELAAMALNQW